MSVTSLIFTFTFKIAVAVPSAIALKAVVLTLATATTSSITWVLISAKSTASEKLISVSAATLTFITFTTEFRAT